MAEETPKQRSGESSFTEMSLAGEATVRELEIAPTILIRANVGVFGR